MNDYNYEQTVNMTETVKETNRQQRLQECDRDRDAADEWQPEANALIRLHHEPRRCLFTPFRVPGSPRGTDLHATRVTTGRFLSGETFSIVDNWRNRHESHRELKGVWVGETKFYCNSGYKNGAP